MEPKGISDPGVLYPLLSVTLQHNRKKCTSSRIGLENVFNVILARKNSGNINIDIGLEEIKSQQANNIDLSLNHVIEPSTFLLNHKIRHKCGDPLIYSWH